MINIASLPSVASAGSWPVNNSRSDTLYYIDASFYEINGRIDTVMIGYRDYFGKDSFVEIMRDTLRVIGEDWEIKTGNTWRIYFSDSLFYTGADSPLGALPNDHRHSKSLEKIE